MDPWIDGVVASWIVAALEPWIGVLDSAASVNRVANTNMIGK
jgi:hypothetical protein